MSGLVPKSLQISSLTALQKCALLLVCFSYCKCGIHLQRPLFLKHRTGSCIRNPGFELCARGEIWVDVWWRQLLFLFSYQMWSLLACVSGMKRRRSEACAGEGWTNIRGKRRCDDWCIDGGIQGCQAETQPAGRLNWINHTACNARGAQDQKSQQEVLPFSSPLARLYRSKFLISLSLAISPPEEELNVKAQYRQLTLFVVSKAPLHLDARTFVTSVWHFDVPSPSNILLDNEHSNKDDSCWIHELNGLVLSLWFE